MRINSDDVERRVSIFAERHQLTLESLLGYGKDGRVYSSSDAPSSPAALKVFSTRNLTKESLLAIGGYKNTKSGKFGDTTSLS